MLLTPKIIRYLMNIHNSAETGSQLGQSPNANTSLKLYSQSTGIVSANSSQR